MFIYSSNAMREANCIILGKALKYSTTKVHKRKHILNSNFKTWF